MDESLFGWLGSGGGTSSPASALASGGSAGGLNLSSIGTTNNNAIGTGLGFNVGTGQLLLGGLSTLGNLWTAWNATELAKKQFDFQKKMSLANYTNQTTTYNTNLEDRARARYNMENKSQGEADAYVAGHKLNTTL